MSDSHWIIAVGALAVLVAGGLVFGGKMDGLAFAATCGAFFGGSAVAAFRQ